ncbi:MAG TPA: DNA-binding protein [Actinomycetota bacterium]|nr:DNA-binding protein [Actinomycetota bacterium]
MGWFRRWLERFRQSDEERLTDEVREWAESIPQTSRIDQCPSREHVRVAGAVRRLTIRPVEGFYSLEALVSDGTGEILVRWMGRHRIPGLGLGTRIVLEGVLGRDRDGLRMVNPQFEFG